MRKHENFILSEMSDMMKEVVFACKAIPAGIETFAANDYIFQTLFMKMTGFQEQKMKCICWELATDDFDFRRDYMQQAGGLGEMSTAASKKYVYQHLVEVIKKCQGDFNPTNDLDKASIVAKVKDDVTKSFEKSPLAESNMRLYQEFPSTYDKDFTVDYFATSETELLAGNLVTIYESLYKHRNRCAHNALSYQQNLPALKQLAANEIIYESYYVRYALLLLIDEVMIGLYKKLL